MPRFQVYDAFATTGALNGHVPTLDGLAWGLLPGGTFGYGAANGGDCGVFTAGGLLRQSPGAGNGDYSLYVNPTASAGPSQDVFFSAVSPTDVSADEGHGVIQVILNYALPYASGSNTIYQGCTLVIGRDASDPGAFRLNATGPAFLSGGGPPSQLARQAVQPGHVYDIHFASRPEATYLWVDGVLECVIGGTITMGIDPNAPGGLAIGMYSRTDIISDSVGWQIDNLRWSSQRYNSLTRPMSVGLAQHLTGRLQTTALLVSLTRADGTVIGFTTHDVPLQVDGVIYDSADGAAATAIRVESGTGVDSADVTGILSSDLVTDTDLRAGLYDNAPMSVDLCNWSNLADGVVNIARGYLGDVTVTDTSFVASFRSLMQRLQQQVGEVYSPMCRVKHLGDSRCKVDLSGNTADGYNITGHGFVRLQRATLALSLSNSSHPDGSSPTGSLVFNAGFYEYGTLRADSGLNAGLTRQVVAHTFGVQESPFNLVQVYVGDAIVLDFGSNPSATDHSSTKFFNVPAGTWQQAYIEIRSTWSIHSGVDPTTAPTDALVVELPSGMANRVTVRQSNSSGTYLDYLDAGDATLDAINTLAGSATAMSVSFRHQAGSNGSARGSDVRIDSAVLHLYGSPAQVGSSYEVIIADEFPYPMSQGDAVTCVAGCDRLPSTCTKKYANILNIRCEPFVPGNSSLMARGRGSA